METHLLNGDALREKLGAAGFGGLMASMRECLLEGPVAEAPGEEFWLRRAAYLAATYPQVRSDYYQQVVAELARLPQAAHQPLNLWFEDDLFCQVNLWFSLHYLTVRQVPGPLYRVLPLPADNWLGFGPLTAADLRRCYHERVLFCPADRQLGTELWAAYATDDATRLQALAQTPTAAFRQLPAVVAAHLERRATAAGPGRPQRTLRALQRQGLHDFVPLFQAFSAIEGIYGFGDLQVQHLLAGLPACPTP